MKSKKPFSTVSYNTKDFLTYKLDELYKKRVISFYAFVQHLPEEDELKSHIHVYIEPNGQQDTDQIHDELEELDPNNPQLPLGCIPFRSSKWGEWKQYCDHDTTYLLSKGQTRKYHYSDLDYVYSDRVYFNELNHTIDRSKLNRNQLIKDAVDNGVSFVDLVKTGQIPVQMIGAFKMMYDLLTSDKIRRATDPETGELIPSHTPKKDPDDDDLPF